MSDGSDAQPTPEAPAPGGATAVKARRAWRVPVDKTPERPGLRGGPAVGAGQRADAVPGAGADPLARLQCRAPELLLELRAARLVPRHRARLPDLQRSWSVLPAAPIILAVLVIFTFLDPVTIDRAGDQIIYFTSLSTTGPTGLAGAAADLHPGGRRAGRAGRGGRPVLRTPAAADRLPLGPGRVADRHHLVHADVLPAGAVGRVGRPGHDRVRAADQQVAALPGRRRRAGDDRGAAGRDAVPGHLLVAVLQDPHRRPGRRRHAADRHLGQRRTAPDHAVGAAAAAGGTAVRVPLRALARATR